MAAEEFVAPIVALIAGEVIATRVSGHLTDRIIRGLQLKVPPGVVDASFANSTENAIGASMATVSGIPTLYLTLVALKNVPALAPLVANWLGVGIAIFGSLAILAYSWSDATLRLANARIFKLSIPTFILAIANLVGLAATVWW